LPPADELLWRKIGMALPADPVTDDREPDVTVVVIVYNDAARLPRAVRSVLDQSLRNVEVVIVDDASTDDSPQVAQRLAAESHGRVRAILRSENSGCCGIPRNDGIGQARGTYVMFLDSDDTLERHACRNMLAAAEETGADVVSGRCYRVMVDRNNKAEPWYPWLYNERRVLESVHELPDLLVWDTLSTNKCYRRAFLNEHNLRYPEHLLYEDLLFSAQIYLAASRITLIPDRVYNWFVIEKGAKRSISNRRHEVRNVTDRMEIHRRVDEALDAAAAADLKLAKDVKFLKHDLVLHLRDLPFRNQEFRTAFLESVRPYLRQIAPDAYERVQPIQRVAADLVLRGDDELLDRAIDQLMTMRSLGSPLARHGERVYWTDRYLDTPEAAHYDVTELDYHSKPISAIALANRLTRLDVSPTRLSLAGELVNPLGRITADMSLSAELELRCTRMRGRKFRVKITELERRDDAIVWRTELDLRRVVRPFGLVDPTWEVVFRLRAGEQTNLSFLIATQVDIPHDSTRARPLLTPLVGDRFAPMMAMNGNMFLQLIQRGAVSRGVVGSLSKLVHSSAGRRAVRRAKKVHKQYRSAEGLAPLYRSVFCRLPMIKGSVVFESHLGKQYSDNPKYIYEELRRRGLHTRATWAYRDNTDGFPTEATLVKRGSVKHLLALARAEYWVDNQGMPKWLSKPERVTYVQTWHGSAYKRMGFDKPELKGLTREAQAVEQRATDRYDYFVVRGEHDIDTLVRAFRVRAKLLRTGYPRNDALVDKGASIEGGIDALRRRLGLTDDRKVVLYAPTFREDPDGKLSKFELAFDVERFVREFGDTHVLLVRTHYLNSVVLPPHLSDAVRNVSHYPDVTELMLLSDVLVTDYSSMMFDFALLDRPMIFYAYDYDQYVNELRGAYFDLAEEAPGPLVLDEDAFFETLRTVAGQEEMFAPRRHEFVKRFGEFDTGDAARGIVDQVFTRGGHASGNEGNR
jgi:CDP-glycerol glycerophosphotransferase